MYGRKVLLGEALEWLFQAASSQALGSSWAVIPEFHENLDEASRDVFDFFLTEKDTIEEPRSMLVQVTHYPEGSEVEEEPNKTYEALETFEEFAYAKSLALEKRTEFITARTALVHVLYGNKRRLRPWAITLFESFLDLCIYPHYTRDGFDATEMYTNLEQIARRIRENVSEGKVAHGREFAELQLMRRNNSLAQSVAMKYDMIIQAIRTYVEGGCQRNKKAMEFWESRPNYKHTQEFKRAHAHLEAQLKKGPPSIRQSVKKSVLARTPIPPQTSDIDPADLMEIIAINETKNPFNKVAQDFLKNYQLRCSEIAHRIASDRRSELLALWREEDLGRRNFLRPFLLAVAGLRADDYFGIGGVGEQTIYLSDLPQEATTRILRDVEKSFPMQEKEILQFLLERKRIVRDLVRNKLWNGTRVDPVSDYVRLLLERELAKGKIHSLTKTLELPTILRHWLEHRKPRLSSYPEHLTHLGNRSATVRFELAVKCNQTTCLIKTKFTENEQNRRSKEEGIKGWLVKCDLGSNGIIFREDYTLMTVLDGKWNDSNSLERLVECGWHVYFDARDLVADVLRISAQ
jgi:hypothetical protein